MGISATIKRNLFIAFRNATNDRTHTLMSNSGIGIGLSNSKCLVQALDGEIDLPLGPWLVASLAKVPVVLLSCFKEGAFTYRLLCSDPVDVTVTDRRRRDEELAQHAQEFAARLETWVRRYPYQFYNFYDVWNPEAASLAD